MNHEIARLQGCRIRPAANDEELEFLYRFRYRIYVEEMQRKQKYADHNRKRICDPLDEFATNLIAWDSDDKIMGTVRTNFSRDGNLLDYAKFYAMDSVGTVHPESTSICTRLMILPKYRRSLLAVRLSLAVYEYGLTRGITHNFIDCNDHLVKFFEHLGYVQHLPKREHEEYGAVTCMRLNVRDLAHLNRVSSPFAPVLVRWHQKLRWDASPAYITALGNQITTACAA